MTDVYIQVIAVGFGVGLFIGFMTLFICYGINSAFQIFRNI